MTRQDQANDRFSLTSFLYGGNADYIEELQAELRGRPAVGRSGMARVLRQRSRTMPTTSGRTPRARPGKARNWPLAANGELVSALDGNWGLVEKLVEKKIKDKAAANGAALSDADVLQATRDSVRAIMMIRAFRMRGHLHANLDPLGLAKPLEDYNELSPEAYGFTEADYDRPIFIDNVLGLEYATIRQMLEILTRTYCSTLGVEFMHISDPEEKAWIQARIEGAGQGHHLHAGRQEGDPAEADRGRGLRAVHRRQVQGHQALRPRRRRVADPGAGADHQARRLARHEGDRARHGPSRPPQRAVAR